MPPIKEAIKRCSGDIMVQVEKPKDYTKPLLELVRECSKVAGNKHNTPKPPVDLQTSYERMDTETKNTIQFYNCAKKLHMCKPNKT